MTIESRVGEGSGEVCTESGRFKGHVDLCSRIMQNSQQIPLVCYAQSQSPPENPNRRDEEDAEVWANREMEKAVKKITKETHQAKS